MVIILIKMCLVMLVILEIDIRRVVSGREIFNFVVFSGMYVNGMEKVKIYRKLKRRKMVNFFDFISFGLMMFFIIVWVGCFENKMIKKFVILCFMLCKFNFILIILILWKNKYLNVFLVIYVIDISFKMIILKNILIMN